MASVIKSGRVIPSGTPVHHSEFNFEDMSQNAAKYLDTVKQKAARIVAQAQQQAQQTIVQARQQGQQAAEQAARQKAKEEVAAKWQTLAPALQQAIAAASEMKATWMKQWEKNLIHLVVGIAEHVIRHELTKRPEISRQWIREALELVSGSNKLTLQLNPADYAALGEELQQIEEKFNQLADARIVADPSVSSGGCRVLTDFGHIDQQLESQLARVEQELTF